MLNIHLTPTEKKIIRRLANYKNKDDLKLFNKGTAIYSTNDIRSKNRRNLNKDKIAINGWLTHEEIELFDGNKIDRKLSPYPEKKRINFLKYQLSNQKKIIEIDTFNYINSKGGKHSEYVYRLLHTREAEAAVYLAFDDSIEQYKNSDYYTDDQCLMRQIENYIREYIRLFYKGEEIILYYPNSFIVAFLNHKIISSLNENMDKLNIIDYLLLTAQYDYIFEENSKQKELLSSTIDTLKIIKDLISKQYIKAAKEKDMAFFKSIANINRKLSVLFISGGSYYQTTNKEDITSNNRVNIPKGKDGPDVLCTLWVYLLQNSPSAKEKGYINNAC